MTKYVSGIVQRAGRNVGAVSTVTDLFFRNRLDLPCFLRFDKPPILKRKTQSFPHFMVNILRFQLTFFLKRAPAVQSN